MSQPINKTPKAIVATGETTSIGSRGKKMQAWGKVVGDLKQSGKILLYTNIWKMDKLC